MNAPPPPGQFPPLDVMIPRFREAGEVTLDLLHRDGRIDDGWLALHPREFALLWRLAQHPGQRATCQQLLAEIWRIPPEPETSSIEANVARLQAKLDSFGLARLIGAHGDGGYYLDVPFACGWQVGAR